MSVLPVDTGYFTGLISYTPSWSSGLTYSISIGTGPDSNGIAWIWEQILGWDSPDIVGTVMQRGADHGGWPAGSWYAPRALTLQVHASAPNQAARDLARMQLQQVLPPNDLCMLQYNEVVPKMVYCRRAGKVTESYVNLCEVDFSAVLIAPDPRKYSTTVKVWPNTSYKPANYNNVGLKGTSTTTLPWVLANNANPGLAAALHNGNFETRPVVIFFGPLHSPGVRYQVTGETVTWNSVNLGTGDILVADFDARASYINPNYIPAPGGPGAGYRTNPSTISGYTPADISSQWFTLYPGFNSLQMLSGQKVLTDNGQMLVYHRDAYM